MSNYIGIDLGTTNSAICSYDGNNVRIWKSPEQNDVTPSAIFIDKRGNRYYGSKAYNQAPYNPDNSATLFKRFMGTDTKIYIKSANLSLTPEECSAEILKVLFGYLPEEIRNDPETATVITVPAAFNQMKKDATLQAAKLAGIGKVALMQEPVAAIMSIMRVTKQEGIFLVYDLGGGTFDISIAENINGKVNLLAHGGIEMCGGRDIDRMVFNKIVVPWLEKTFALPVDFLVSSRYKTFCRVAQWATERAKIELSATESCTIALSESEARIMDDDGNEMYIDIDLTRRQVDEIMSDLVAETIAATRETMQKAGLNANDIEKIVFVGGPTNYKPLRDKVCQELALPGNIDVNPMTAVAEGASIFAESIDWSSEKHNRKAANETVRSELTLSLKYTSRTSAERAKVMCVLEKPMDGYSIQFVSLDSGWTSGNAPLRNNLMIDLPMSQNGENRFEVRVFDEFGHEVKSGIDPIVVTRTLATIGAIPASHSIGVEVVNKLGGTPELEFLIHEGDALPKKGSTVFRAGETVHAGSVSDSINIKIWEGSIQYPITDNRFVGMLKITGTDLESGMIPTGAEIECEYEMTDSGNIILDVSIPSVSASFTNHNFYSRQEGQTNLDNVDKVADEGREIMQRIRQMKEKVNSEDLDKAEKKASIAANIDSQPNCEPENVQKANNELLDAKKLMNRARKDNLKEIRQMELDELKTAVDSAVRKHATPAELQDLDNMIQSAQRSIDRNDNDFDNIVLNIRRKASNILVKQDWFIVVIYRDIVSAPHNFVDPVKFRQLKQAGDAALAMDDIQTLREVIDALNAIRISHDDGNAMFAAANIVKG